MAYDHCAVNGNAIDSQGLAVANSRIKMPSGKKHKDFKASSSGTAEVVLGGGTYMKKETPGNVLGELL